MVDDNASLAMLMADILEAEGFKVHAANSGVEALKFMAEQPVDILLTDVKMPEMNGLELFRQVKQAYPDIVTIFMTAYAAHDLIQQVIAEGVKTVLIKPVDIKFLLLLFKAHRRLLLNN